MAHDLSSRLSSASGGLRSFARARVGAPLALRLAALGARAQSHRWRHGPRGLWRAASASACFARQQPARGAWPGSCGPAQQSARRAQDQGPIGPPERPEQESSIEIKDPHSQRATESPAHSGEKNETEASGRHHAPRSHPKNTSQASTLRAPPLLPSAPLRGRSQPASLEPKHSHRRRPAGAKPQAQAQNQQHNCGEKSLSAGRRSARVLMRRPRGPTDAPLHLPGATWLCARCRVGVAEPRGLAVFYLFFSLGFH